ncbi:pectinesterase precursor [Apiospora marii]|uniref:Pectinesterase n=1 Tax=Apiospora marii TaxID=335849 RepID=A0ABR1SRM1_9PEZI
MASTSSTSLFEVTPLYVVPRDTGFGLFPKLPIELRRLIWIAYLQQQQRIITIQIIPERGGHRDERKYEIEAQKRYQHSKLFRVCHEARTAALDFFSVRIPCANLDALVPLYFSPECDVLYITQGSCCGLTWLMDLLPKLKTTYDCRGMGVLNLAIGHHALGDYPGVDVTDYLERLETPARKAFTEAVSHLRQLWVMALENGNTRAMIGGLSFLDSKVHHNRAVPVFPLLQTFTRLPTDPRPIERDLGHIATFYSPQELVNRWRQLEVELGINRHSNNNSNNNNNREQQQLAPPLDLRVLLAVAATTSSEYQTAVVDRDTARELLAKEDCAFRDHTCTMFDAPVPYWGDYVGGEAEWADLRRRLPDAVGFWLFPPDAFADDFAKNGVTTLKRARDLRGHPPELCVFDMD